jgi:uncharacterized protein (TIGR00369 family)
MMTETISPPADCAATRNTWLADYSAARARVEAGRGFGLATRQEIAPLSGLAQMQAMTEGRLPAPHITQTMDFILISVAHGQAIFQGTPQLKHYNPLGSVHGGWYATLLDSAVGCAVHTTIAAGRAYTTAEVSVNIVRAASETSGPLRAIGQVIHSGRQLATAEGRIVDVQGKVYAHATTTCLVFDLPAPRAA